MRAEVGRELEVEEVKRAAREVAAQAKAAQLGLKGHLQQTRQPLVGAIAEINVASTNAPTAIAASSAGMQRLASDDVDGVRGKLALGEVDLDAAGKAVAA